MPASFTTETPSHRQRLFLLITGVALTGLTLGVLVFGRDIFLPPLPAFVPFYSGVVIFATVVTAFMLALQFRINHQPTVLFLSTAYLYSGLSAIGPMVFFPGVISDQGIFASNSQAGIWMWVVWHTGFPIFVLAYALTEKLKGDVRLQSRHNNHWVFLPPLGIVLLVIAQSWGIIANLERLPVLLWNGDYDMLLAALPARISMGLNLLTFLALMMLSRRPTIGQVGLMLALLSSLLDVTLTMHAQSRFSLAWYLAKGNSLLSSTTVLAVFLYEISHLYYRVASLNSTLTGLAFNDALTGLPNRRAFDQRLETEWVRAIRARTPLALIILDVDYFKRFNDHYGHLRGDECLQDVAATIREAVKRPADMVCRYGGEEFAVILPETSEGGALRVAEQIRLSVSARGIAHAASQVSTAEGTVSVSLGVAVLRPRKDENLDLLKAAADAALYDAKDQGRNRANMATLAQLSLETMSLPS